MTEPVKIPVQIKYDGTGFQQLTRDAQKAERAAMAATRQQIQAQRNLSRLTAGLDRSLAPQRPSFEQRVGGAVRGQLIGAASIAGAAAMARQTAQTAAELVQLDSQAKTTRQTFLNLSGGAAAAAENMDAMDRATRNLISDQKEQAIANQLLGMQLVSNAQELETLVSGARRLGKEFKGMNAEEAAADFAALLANMSYLRLDQFGLSSAKVRERVNELKAAGMGAEEAFKTAVFEEMEKTLARLGPETETAADKANRLNAEWTNLKTTAGDTLTTLADTSGILDAMAASLDGANKALKDFNDASKAMDIVEDKARNKLDPAMHQTLDTLDTLKAITNPLAFAFEKVATYFGTAAVNADGLAAAYDELEAVTAETTGATDDNTAATEDNTAAQKRLEEELKRLERVRETQRDTILSIKDIEERAAEDSAQAWQDWSEDVSKLSSQAWKNIEQAQADSAKTQRKIQQDLRKDLAKADQDLGKDLEKLRQQNAKRDRRAAEDDARQEKRDRRVAQVDAMADERLFQFELRQMGAEGDAIGIQQALERRAIEEEIAREKSATEAQFEDEDRRVQQQRQREDDAERVQDLRSAAEERKAEIEAAAEEAAAAERAALKETIAAENESYSERRAALESALDERQAAIESGSQEAIQALAEELVRAGELTEEELGKLTTAAGRIGKEVGTAFAYGIRKGTQDVSEAEGFLGLFGGGGDGAAATGGSRGSTNRSMMQRDIPGFALGGVVPGPIGAPTLAVVHGGETITPPGQAGDGVTIVLNNPSFGNVVSQDEILGYFRDFAKEILKPALRR